MKNKIETKYVIIAFGKKCYHDVELTLPCSEKDAHIILNALKNIKDDCFVEMFDNFRITEIACNRCYYFSGKSECWAIKDVCDKNNAKCEYRFNTLFKL